MKSLRAARATHRVVSAPKVRPEKQLFAEAFVVSLLNPKVALFFLAFLPQFVERGHGPIWSQTLVLGVDLHRARPVLRQRVCVDRRPSRHSVSAVGPRELRASRYAEGGILVGLGVLTLALPHRKASS